MKKSIIVLGAFLAFTGCEDGGRSGDGGMTVATGTDYDAMISGALQAFFKAGEGSATDDEKEPVLAFFKPLALNPEVPAEAMEAATRVAKAARTSDKHGVEWLPRVTGSTPPGFLQRGEGMTMNITVDIKNDRYVVGVGASWIEPEPGQTGPPWKAGFNLVKYECEWTDEGWSYVVVGGGVT